MRRLSGLAFVMVIAVGSLATHPADAQVVAMDPSLMTGYAGGAAAHYDNQRRSQAAKPQTPSSRAAATARAKQHCARKEQFRAELGDSDPRVGKIYQMSAQLGL